MSNSGSTAENYQKYWTETLEPFYKSGKIVSVQSKVQNLRLHGVFYAHAESKQKSVKTVLIVPGRTEGSLKYTETCFDIYSKGYNVLVYGHRGQGFSQRILPNSQIGYVEDFDDYVTDLDSWFAKACELGGSGHLHIIAHSMGALICLKWLDQSVQKVSSVCFTSPMLKFDFGKIPETVVKSFVYLKCLLGLGKEFSVKPGELNPVTYGADLTTCSERLAWYRSVLIKFPELQLGYPSNHWLKVSLQEQSKWSLVRLQNLLIKYPSTPFVSFLAEKDCVVRPHLFPELGTLTPQFSLFTLPSAMHDVFIEKSEIRKTLNGHLFSLWAEKERSEKENSHAS
jgi:lysophospholipase